MSNAKHGNQKDPIYPSVVLAVMSHKEPSTSAGLGIRGLEAIIAHCRGSLVLQLRTLTGKELPWLISVAEVCGPLQHPEVRPR